jgi:hypothetical protein
MLRFFYGVTLGSTDALKRKVIKFRTMHVPTERTNPGYNAPYKTTGGSPVSVVSRVPEHR